nr:hypothetical protein [Tanacetum cinerariifolium]
MASEDARLSKFEAVFKQQQSKMTNKIDTFLKIDKYFAKGQQQIKVVSVNESETPKPKEPDKAIEDEFTDLHINLLVLEVLAHDPMYNAILDKNVESLKLGKNGSAYVQNEFPNNLEDPGVFSLPCRLGDSKPFVLGLADGNKAHLIGVVRDVETRPVFRVKEVDHGEEEVSYWTTQARRPSYGPRRNTDITSPLNPFYLENEFMSRNLPTAWEIDRDAKLNPFKDMLVFRKMIESLGPINLKELIDPDGEKFVKVFRTMPTTRKLSEKNKPSDSLDFDHLHDS